MFSTHHMTFGSSLVRKLITRTFDSSNSSWVTPVGVTQLASVVGYGDGGTMDTTVTVNQPRITSIETLFVRDTNQPNYTTVTESDGGSGNPADNYCGPAEQWTMDDSTVYYGRQTCYQFDTYQKTVTTPGSRGDDSTAFGFNFPGGPANGAATTTEYDNVAVTPGATNVFSISPNGLITVTYWAYV